MPRVDARITLYFDPAAINVAAGLGVLRGAVALSVALSVMAGCGTSESDVHDAVRQSAIDGGLTGAQADDVADCAAPRLVKELSADELTELVEQNKVTGSRNAVVDQVLAVCLADAVG